MNFLGRTLCATFALLLVISAGSIVFIRAISDPSNTLMILSQREGEGRLYLVDTQSGISQRLTDELNLVYYVGTTSDSSGEWLYFQAQDPRVRFDLAGVPTGRLYRIRPDGTDMQRLGDQRIQLGTIVWTPDRKWLLYLWNGAGFRPNLWAVRADGTESRSLTDGFNGYIGAQNGPGLFFSPDGEWVAFSGRRSGSDKIGIYQVRLDGAGLTDLTANFEGHFVLRGWPTQTWMLVVRDRVLYRLQADGSQLTTLSAAVPPNRSDVSGWVQEGTLLVASTIHNSDTSLVALDSTIDAEATPRWILNDSAFVDFTPDQQSLIARREGGTRLVRVSLDGNTLTDLVFDPLLERTWGYTPDQKWLLFTSAGANRTILRRIRLSDGLVETLHTFDMPIRLHRWDGDEWLIVQSQLASHQPSTFWQIRPDGSEIYPINGITDQDTVVQWNADIDHGKSPAALLLGSFVVGISYFVVRHRLKRRKFLHDGFSTRT